MDHYCEWRGEKKTNVKNNIEIMTKNVYYKKIYIDYNI